MYVIYYNLIYCHFLSAMIYTMIYNFVCIKFLQFFNNFFDNTYWVDINQKGFKFWYFSSFYFLEMSIYTNFKIYSRRDLRLDGQRYVRKLKIKIYELFKNLSVYSNIVLL
ncbi:hypothetical protein EDEG_00402 [Edhazardia aedis USNM 41457]|uniref:Uncharacterized protein n=1 Tax=Edhazardia aedis (strain USNM 41457) TaxID=1003232 RepID=J9DJS3_EDHAE|nr:hypothetical protein EDEG_00402 [Edhazardia aedis USNM 41457]|eukprot:EJW01587.1 hypothetical protein EDEG_00402 [Edhazardia aedis USNM 41457]